MTAKLADKSQSTCNNGGAPCPECKCDGDMEIFDRKKLLALTSSLILETHDRISGERFRLRDGDKERLQYLRALTGLIALHTSLLEKAGAPLLEGYIRDDAIDKLIRGDW